MTEDHVSGLALITASIGMVIVLGIHPSGPMNLAQVESVVRKLIVVHTLALLTLPLFVCGAWGLWRRLAPSRAAGAAMAVYALAIVALMNAAVIDGLVSPTLIRQIVTAPAAASETWRLLFKYNGYLDQVFGEVYIVGASLAITLWSASIVGGRSLSRGVGILGCVLGPLLLIAVFAGVLSRSAHAFSAAILVQGLWFMSVGMSLLRARDSTVADRPLVRVGE